MNRSLALESVLVSKSRSEIEYLLPNSQLVQVVGSLLTEDGYELVLEGLPLFVFAAIIVLGGEK